MPRKRRPSPCRASSASRNNAVATGCFFARFHATFINSKPTGVGACKRWLSISSITSSAPGSAKAITANAEASTTLSAIAHLADDVDRAFTRGQVQPFDALEDLAHGDRGHVVGRPLDEIEQLALERPAVARGAFAQPFDHPFGDVLAGKTDSHDGFHNSTKMEPQEYLSRRIRLRAPLGGMASRR